MITDILYRCPVCGAFDWLAGDLCRHCRATVEVPSRTEIIINGQREALPFWYDRILAFALPPSGDGTILRSNRVRLSGEQARGVFTGRAGIRATFFTRRFLEEGHLSLEKAALVFTGKKGLRRLDFEQVTSLTIESNTLIVVTREGGVHFFDFLEESGKQWEDLTRRALEDYHAPRRIVEFFPHLRLDSSPRRASRTAQVHPQLRVPVTEGHTGDAGLLLTAVKGFGRVLLRTLLPLKIEGLGNIPAQGPAVLLANHTSFLDSIILGVFSRRNICFMAKNSQFDHPLMFHVLRKAHAFPVRRYTPDLQAVRNAVRVVQAGHVLGIFPEGERSWDGRLLPFKEGTLRLILALGLPVVPVGIQGAYALMPRWTGRVKRVPVSVRIGAPFRFDHIPLPLQAQPDIEAASHTLKSRMQALLGAQA